VPSVEIQPFRDEFIAPAAALFAALYRKQRQAAPILPDRLEPVDRTCERLGQFFKANPGLAALENGRLAGYLGWLVVDDFRETGRRGAYCPIWAHAAAEGAAARVYPALYRQAAGLWAAAACRVHAISLLADDHAAQEIWFWNGFGLTVVDAIRPVQPLDARIPGDIAFRKATVEDAGLIAEIEVEHMAYYTQPPIFMAPREPVSADAYRDFIRVPSNAVWLAFAGADLAGYMRFEPYGYGAVEIVQSQTTIANSGAFIRPVFRGRGAGAGLLDAALRDYAPQGFQRCSVDFESFNPDAFRFWVKHFTPVSLSVTRRPEAF